MCTGRSYLKEAYNAIYQNDFNKAIEAFNNAISCEPRNASYYFKLSVTYSRSGDVKKALEASKQAYELQPEIQLYRYHLQILQSKNMVLVAADKMKKGNLTLEIEELLTHAKNLDPLNMEAYLLLGVYFAEKKYLKKALKEFNQVLNLEPQNQRVNELKTYYINRDKDGGTIE